MTKIRTLAAGIIAALGARCSNGSSGPPAYTPTYQPVAATSQGNLYTLQMGDLKMVVDASAGARVTEFSSRGTNALSGTDVHPTNYGSTYWPSPQSSWCSAGGGCWPPIAAIDSQPYTGAVDTTANTIQLTSGTASIAAFAGSQVTVTKLFTPVPASGAVDVTYTLTNTSSSVSVSVAPWQISRVHGPGGLTFFGQGSGSVNYASGGDPAFAFTAANGDEWYSYAPVVTGSKALADGMGWIGHVTQTGLFYLLAFPDIPASEAAPGEAEVEVYTGTDGNYVEIETQGALATVAPGGTLVWTIRWKLRPVPGGTSVTVGSAALATLASTTLAQ